MPSKSFKVNQRNEKVETSPFFTLVTPPHPSYPKRGNIPDGHGIDSCEKITGTCNV